MEDLGVPLKVRSEITTVNSILNGFFIYAALMIIVLAVLAKL